MEVWLDWSVKEIVVIHVRTLFMLDLYEVVRGFVVELLQNFISEIGDCEFVGVKRKRRKRRMMLRRKFIMLMVVID
jgi:hypothetical protein